MYTLVTFILPFLVLAFFSILLIRVYRAQRRRRAAMFTARGSSTSSRSSATVSEEHSVTRVIVVVMLVFVVCNLPAKVFDNANPECGTVGYVTRRLSFVLEVANSTANFVVYCALRHQFREGLRRALTPLQSQSTCRRQQTYGEEAQRGTRQLPRTASPVDLEMIQIENELPRSHLDVHGVVYDRNSVTSMSATLQRDSQPSLIWPCSR